MEDIGLFKQGWEWVLSQKHAFSRAKNAMWRVRDRICVFVERHWPMVWGWCSQFWKLLLLSLIYWRDCLFRGFQSVIEFGSASLLVILWSCFLSLTSMSCLIYVVLSMVCLPLVASVDMEFIVRLIWMFSFWNFIVLSAVSLLLPQCIYCNSVSTYLTAFLVMIVDSSMICCFRI